MPRVLSEDEYNAVVQDVLKHLPAGLDEQSYNRMVKSSLAGAVATAENSPEPLRGSSLGRALSGWWNTVNPAGLLEMAVSPDARTRAAISAGLSMSDQYDQMRNAPTRAEQISHGLAAIVPGGANVADAAYRGDLANVVGQTAGALTPVAAKMAAPSALDVLQRVKPGEETLYGVQKMLGRDPTVADRLSEEATMKRLQAARATSRQMGLPPLRTAMRNARNAPTPEAPAPDVSTPDVSANAAPPPVDDSGRVLGGYAGPERRVTSAGPPEAVLERRAANAKLAETGGGRPKATSPAETPPVSVRRPSRATPSAESAAPPPNPSDPEAGLRSAGLSQEEAQQAVRWKRAGIADDQIVKRIVTTRALLGAKPELKNLPTLAEALAEVRNR